MSPKSIIIAHESWNSQSSAVKWTPCITQSKCNDLPATHLHNLKQIEILNAWLHSFHMIQAGNNKVLPTMADHSVHFFAKVSRVHHADEGFQNTEWKSSQTTLIRIKSWFQIVEQGWIMVGVPSLHRAHYLVSSNQQNLMEGSAQLPTWNVLEEVESIAGNWNLTCICWCCIFSSGCAVLYLFYY